MDRNIPPPHLNPRNPLNWLRLGYSIWLHLGDWYRKPLAWTAVDLYPHLIRFSWRPRSILFPTLVFALLVVFPLCLYRWGHLWGYQPLPPLVLFSYLIPSFALVDPPSPFFGIRIPLVEFIAGPLPPNPSPISFRRSYRWLSAPLYAYSYWTGSLSSLFTGSFQLNWTPLTPAFFTLPLALLLIFLFVEYHFRLGTHLPVLQQLYSWPHIRYAPEITPLSDVQPVRWFLYHQRMELRDLFIAEQQWDLSFEPDNTWSPDRWRKIEVGITAGCFPVYLILIILWFPYRFFLLPLFLLTYPFRLFYLLDAEYTRILYSSWQLIGAAYRGILQLVIPPINPLAGYLYPHLRRRWELFNTYYWAHWWDQFVYEPSYEFLIKTEIRMDFLDGEWLPEEQEEDGWWLRMVRNRRYRFPAYRFLLSRLYWTPFQLPPLFLLTYPFGLFYQIFLYPFLLAPLRLVLAHLSHQSRILALANSPVSALFSSPGTFFLALPPLQRHWAPRQESFDLFIRTSRVDLKRWIWDRLLPGWFLHCSPRIQLFRSIVFPWSLVPLAFILLLTPLAPLLSSKFLYRPLGGDFLLIIILGTLFLQLAPPLRRWSYWDFRYLLPLSMVVVMFFQTGLWPPRLWGPKYWGFQFLFFLCSGPIPWLLAFVKPLLLLPLTVPLFFYDLLAVPLPLFLADLSLLVQSLLRLVGWWLYHPWGWLLEILWNHVIWPPIATPWYHLDLWYYYSLKPLLFLLFRWIRWFAALGFWLICQLLVLPLRAYWQFPDLGWVQPTPWLHHILLDGWCPFPRLTDPSPPSPPFWGPRWVKPPILTNPRLLPSFPWPPPL